MTSKVFLSLNKIPSNVCHEEFDQNSQVMKFVNISSILYNFYGYYQYSL